MERPLSQQPTSATHDLVQEGLRHHQAGQFAEAERIYQRVLTINPHHPDALHLLGMIAYQTGHNEAAAEFIRSAIAIKADAASYHSNLGNVLQSQGKLAEAGACYQRALVLKPDLIETHLNLGNIFKAQGDVDSSVACYRRALALNPASAEAAVAESMALLLKGDFASGWRNFERRWQTKDYDTQMRRYAQPLWSGEPLTTGRLLLWGEQGIGDEIMFAGLIPDVIRTGTRCVLDCDARLRPLFARSFPAIDVVVRSRSRKSSGIRYRGTPALRQSARPLPNIDRCFRSDHIALPHRRSIGAESVPRALLRWPQARGLGLAYEKQEDRPQSLHRSATARHALRPTRHPLGQPAVRGTRVARRASYEHAHLHRS